MTTMSNSPKPPWIKLDPESLTEAAREPISMDEPDVRIEVSVSPYDVPEAMRGYFEDDEERSFVIQFKYLDDEPTEEREAGPFATLHVGKNSGRLYRIEVDVEGIEKAEVTDIEAGVERIGLELKVVDAAEQAVEAFTQSHPEPARTKNLEVAQSVLSDHEQDLVRSAAQAE